MAFSYIHFGINPKETKGQHASRRLYQYRLCLGVRMGLQADVGQVFDGVAQGALP